MTGPRVGIDVGGTKTAMVALWPERQEVARTATGRDTHPTRIEADIRGFIAALGDVPDSIGVAVPGLVDPAGTVAACDVLPHLVGWNPLRALRDCAPTTAANDAEAALIEESHGLGPGATAAMVMAGTGVGAAIMAHGRILRGTQGWAGELGSIPLRAGDRVAILDALAGGAALVDRLGGDPAALQARAEAGETAALSEISVAGSALGLGLATLINLINPTRLVLGGGTLTYPGYLNAALSSAKRHSLPELWTACEICPTAHGDLVAALGAARLGAGGVNP